MYLLQSLGIKQNGVGRSGRVDIKIPPTNGAPQDKYLKRRKKNNCNLPRLVKKKKKKGISYSQLNIKVETLKKVQKNKDE